MSTKRKVTKRTYAQTSVSDQDAMGVWGPPVKLRDGEASFKDNSGIWNHLGTAPGLDPWTGLAPEKRYTYDLFDKSADQVLAPDSTKLTNPKDMIGSTKIPVTLWPETATIMGSLGLLDGALKYGRANWRVAGVRASIYVDACRRHLAKWFEGETVDPDSGLPHMSHALACLAIIVDAQAAGKLNDDRMVPGGYAKLVGELTPHVARLKALHKDKAPRHYTIADDPCVCEPSVVQLGHVSHINPEYKSAPIAMHTMYLKGNCVVKVPAKRKGVRKCLQKKSK